MKKEIKTQEIITYKYDDDEKREILERLLKNNIYALETYYDYNDKLSEEQILKIITEEDGLSEVESELIDYNFDYVQEEISRIIQEELTNEEETDEDLIEYLKEELESRWNYNILEILKNSSVRMRIELMTNEDFGFIPEMREKKGEYYKLISKVFKNHFEKDNFDDEINSHMGSDYSHLTFFFKIGGEDILRLREEYQKGKITLNKNIGCGLFNSYLGCGGDLEIHLTKPITLNVKNWTNNKKYDNGYYNLSLKLDGESYGIQETYGLTGECWKDY